MNRWWDRWALCTLMVMWAVFALLVLPGCAQGMVQAPDEEDQIGTVVPTCTLDQVQHPFRDGKALPGGRGFMASGNHLGWDLMAPEGMPVYPLGCGVVRVARSAQGYGTLAVVIEHRLRTPLLVTNGVGSRVSVSSFLSIYGHLRSTSEGVGRGVSTGLRVGDTVNADTVIGYVEHRSANGDGDEHLHFGIRLQSASSAQRSDPTGWFRGYDAVPSQRSWFTDPVTFLRQRAEPVPVPPEPTPSIMDAGVRDVLMVAPRRRMANDAALPPVSDVLMDAGSVLRPDIVPALAQDVIHSQPDLVTPPPPPPQRYRYEFRVRSTLRVSPPYVLRDHWWGMVHCDNTGQPRAEFVDGWARCDAARLELFDGSVLLPDHLDWGDQGQIGTVANTPRRCTPTMGAEWRIRDLVSQRLLFEGPVSGLVCRAVGSQDRLAFPE